MADFTLNTRISQQLINRDEWRATGGAALAQSLPADSMEIEEVRLHLDAAATQEDFTMTINSGDGTEYDTNILTVDMSQDADGNVGVVTDVVFRPVRPIPITRKEVVEFAWTNTDTATWGLTVIVCRKSSS